MWIILSSTLKITSFDGSTLLECPTDSNRLHKQASVLATGEHMQQQDGSCDRFMGSIHFNTGLFKVNCPEKI